jgi:hypothetical protein
MPQIKTKLSERRARDKATKPKRVPDTPGMVLEPVSAANSETGEDELYMVIGGERMAYRGHPDTPDAGKWVSINPDRFVIHDAGLPPDHDPTDAEARAIMGLPDDCPIIEGGEVQTFPEPKGRVQ